MISPSYLTTIGLARMAMRADFLRAQRPSVWAAKLGPGPLLSLLTVSQDAFCKRAGCTAGEVDEFNRHWLATPAGRQWGMKPN